MFSELKKWAKCEATNCGRFSGIKWPQSTLTSRACGASEAARFAVCGERAASLDPCRIEVGIRSCERYPGSDFPEDRSDDWSDQLGENRASEEINQFMYWRFAASA